ncbi:complex I NDUFA9 subunit family protein [Halostagnicola sp. A-GB9-2]|uniref:complex I NDUFA9 subunit family protein n=1 Tax=Halostagnicola sp. A-GB9-2 TaxID=3048066 RepID=UPI0024C073C7|nr:complex I NDUFA9 subunit family protein [Halostagnicola sp. A-GB9-2]MDJ1431247.1 complex I NDUFA9 subunit family protein [Halostagnicola sp. A-GB9-2]
MNVLVTGGTGFIGTNLCEELASRGHDVTALSRRPDDGSLPAGVDVAMGDVSAYDSIADTVAEHDAVINLVALSPLFQPNGDTSHEEVHLEGTKNLVRAAEEGDTDRFVQMSALDAHPHAETAYLRTKGRAEEVIRDSTLEWTIFRPSVVFGDGAEFVEFTKTLTTPYVTGLPGGGKTPFQPIWVEDLVPMLADAVEDGEHVGQTYEIGGPDVYTLAEVTKLAYEADGRSVAVLPIPTALANVGLSAVGPVPFVPFGPDQARALEIDNTVSENNISAFGVNEAELRTLPDYLGVNARDPERTASVS